jgi:small conductance mechanosensitive channel
MSWIEPRIVLRALAVLAIEVGSLAVLFTATYAIAIRLLQRLSSVRVWGTPDLTRTVAKTRRIAFFGCLTAILAIIGYNGWLVWRGIDVPDHTIKTVLSLSLSRAFAIVLGQAALAALVILAVRKFIRRALQSLRQVTAVQPLLSDRRKELEQLFDRLDRVVVLGSWVAIVVVASHWLPLPQLVADSFLLVARLSVVFGVGIIAITVSGLFIDVVDDWGRGYMRSRGRTEQYDHLRRLVPTLRVCAEYALWIVVAALLVLQLAPLSALASWGPRLVEAIGIFFLGRVIIEAGHLEIGRRMLPVEGLDEMEHRRRATIVPLVRSIFTYATYFATATLMLSVLGFNPMPFLAGAGLLGLVVGFGAQSLINDVVSGFFILFENVYLVGDLIETTGARGLVEAIEFRVTKIRDGDGRLYIIRNGDVKPVVNYSKGYAVAVVPLEVSYDCDIRTVFSTLSQAGARVRASDKNVLSETRIDGITAFGPSTMSIRTSTRVKAGCHESIAAALRLAIKEEFDRLAAVNSPRTTLVPEPVRAVASR